MEQHESLYAFNSPQSTGTGAATQRSLAPAPAGSIESWSLPASARKAHEARDCDDDAGLVRAAKMGDIAAFEELVKRHTTVIFRVAMHILNAREDAEDVAQEAFLKAFQHLARFEERARFSSWVTRIAVNTALERLRNAKRAPAFSLDVEVSPGVTWAENVRDWKPNPEQLFRREELREILQQALASLPEIHRVVFLLRDVQGLSVAETAEMLEQSVANVKTRLFRARAKLRKYLSKYFEVGASAKRACRSLQHSAKRPRSQEFAL